jgi:hypothetical protein
MRHLSRKCVAVLLAVWLPLFSGNALAVSVAMQSVGGQSMSGGCHDAMQTSPAHHDMSGHQHDHQSNQQQSSHKDCGVCQLACCGYMAAATTGIAGVPLPAQSFIPVPTQFQSVTSAPLDPPPLVRA